MNADELLRHYERVADAPEAVARLRRFILDLAVRGKLVPQDSKDEPVSELLNEIDADKARVGLEPDKSRMAPEKAPFSLPSGWCWSSVGEICSKTGSGSTPRGGQAAYATTGVPFLRSQNIYNDGLRLDDVAYVDAATHARMAGTSVRAKDLLLNITGGSIGRCCRVPDAFGEANISQHVAIIRPAISAMSDFLHCLVLSPYFQRFVVDEQTGAGRGGLPKNRMDRIAIAMPPLAEQHRIVAKVDDLMALCDRLEAARAQREAARDRLARSCLARLDTPDPEAFREDARFALDALPALTARPDQIKPLRQTILNLAVRGKLVQQDPDDEPATALLARILGEKTRLAKIEGRKAPHHASTDDAPDFRIEIPTGWASPTWDAIAQKIGDIDHKMPEAVDDGIPYISPRDFLPGNGINFDGAKRVSREDFVRLAVKIRPEVGDLIFPRYGTIGENRLVLDSRDFLASYSCCVIKLLHGFIHPRFQYFFSISDICRLQAKAAENKTTQANVGIQSIKEFVVPLPPLAEQHRIVTKVDELMALCDRLEASLQQADAHRRRLLEALLHEALEPAAALEEQVA